MKRRILALITAFVMVVTMLPASAFAEGAAAGAGGTETGGTSVNAQTVSTADELVNAVAQNNAKIVLDEDIYLDKMLTISAEGVEIDLGKHSITASQSFDNSNANNSHVINVTGKNVEIKNGTIASTDKTKNPLSLYGAENAVIESLILDRTTAGYAGSAIVVNGSSLIVKGNNNIKVGANTWHAINVDSTISSLSSITFDTDSVVDINSNKVPGVFVEKTNDVAAPIVKFESGVAGQNLNVFEKSEADATITGGENIPKYVLVSDAAELAKEAAVDGSKIVLENDITLDSAITVSANDVVIDINGKTISGGITSGNLVTVSGTGVTVKNGTIAAGAGNKHVLQFYNTTDGIIENLTLDHSSSALETGGAPLIVNASTVTAKGNITLKTDKQSWYGVNIDNGLQTTIEAMLTVADGANIKFEGETKDAVGIKIECSNGNSSGITFGNNVVVYGAEIEKVIENPENKGTINNPEGAGLESDGNGNYGNYVAEFNNQKYSSLVKAVEALLNTESKKGIVTLLKNTSGGGIGIFNMVSNAGVNLTIDFGGYTYTMTDPAVGSPGTESQGFHFEKDNKVILKNGTVKVDESSIGTKMLVQNYANLTLENLNLIGAKVTEYIISSNYGNVNLTNVSISGTHPGLVAIDIMHWHGMYEDKAPTMVINNDVNHVVNGKIDAYCYGTGSDNCDKKPEEKIESGVFNTNPKEYSGNEIVARTSGNFYVGSAASSRMRSLSAGDEVEILNGSSIEVPDGVTVSNSTGHDIIVNGDKVEAGEEITVKPEPPVIVYPVISRIAAIADQEYTGSAITPALTVYDTNGNIVSSNNYTATYTNNVEPGTATVTVTGKAGVMGSATATFTIVKKEDPQPPQPEKPGKVEITKSSSDFGRIRVYFDKVAAVGDNTMRYQIQSQKVGSDVVKTQYATVGYSYATVRDLAYNAKYNIKVRAYYVDENGERIYGDWSEVKTVYANRLGTANQVMYKAGITKLTAGKTSVAVNLKKVAFTKNPVKITYQIAYKKKGATKFSYAYTTNLKKTVYNLSKNTNYQFKVRYYYKSLVDDKLVFSSYTALKTVKTAK